MIFVLNGISPFEQNGGGSEWKDRSSAAVQPRDGFLLSSALSTAGRSVVSRIELCLSLTSA